jgi:prevent-host-death family protein
MRIAVSQAKGQLLGLVRRAEAGEEVELTRRGHTVAKLVAAPKPRLSPEEKGRIIDEIMESARGKATPGPCAARSADFLYDDETGLPA